MKNKSYISAKNNQIFYEITDRQTEAIEKLSKLEGQRIHIFLSEYPSDELDLSEAVIKLMNMGHNRIFIHIPKKKNKLRILLEILFPEVYGVKIISDPKRVEFKCFNNYTIYISFGRGDVHYLRVYEEEVY